MKGRTATRTHLCRSCHGRGEVHFSPTHEEHPCRSCAGTGYITKVEYNAWNQAGLDSDLAKRLRERGARAFDEHDEHLARLLREAAERIKKIDTLAEARLAAPTTPSREDQ